MATDFGEAEPGKGMALRPLILLKVEITNPLCSDANYHPQSLWCHPGDR